MNIREVKKIFIDYFKSKGHQIVPSSSLLPKDDPSIMFTNAGMNQFKNVFMGRDTRSYTKASSIQKCVRAGGKHNDLDMVGKTARHHTFFEMLGNFSFGDYFKEDAIKMAWELLTEVYKIDKERLYVTVYKTDDEAYDIWYKQIGIPKHKIYKMDADNFWSMGNTGPCGPSTEIFYDHGKEYACSETCDVGCECDRFVEIWNLVFMEFNRKEDGSLEALPKKSVDTGAGVERLSAVMQGVVSNYDIEFFKKLKSNIAKILNLNFQDLKSEEQTVALNVIADHIRSASFLISDACVPSNEGAGYVLRRIIRRAIRYGNKFGAKEPFMYKVVDKLVELMGGDYPILKELQNYIKKILKTEEIAFFKTLERGLKLIEDELKTDSPFLPNFVFKLYDTYGFPIDLTRIIAEEKGISIDLNAVNKLMEKQKTRARSGKAFDNKKLDNFQEELIKSNINATEFLGYKDFSLDAKLIYLKEDGDKIFAIFDKTPFYAESGGQIADTGFIYDGDIKIAEVVDVQKPVNKIFIHSVKLLENKSLEISKIYKLTINKIRRDSIAKNHTATHILHFLLRKYLGKHVKQAGSFVSDKILRFDFNNTEAVSKDLLAKIEEELNFIIQKAYNVNTEEKDYEEAIKSGVMALFNEKYDKVVRVVSVDDFSVELCGGTHINNTSQIGVFKIKSEASIASGIRRIESSTGFEAYKNLSKSDKIISEISTNLSIQASNIILELNKQKEKLIKYETEINEIKKQNFVSIANDLISTSKTIADIKFIYKNFKDIKPKDMKSVLDIIRSKDNNLISILQVVKDSKISLIINVSKSLTEIITARVIFKIFEDNLGIRGGGSPEMVQAGGPLKIAIPNNFKDILFNKIKEMIGD